MSSLLSFITSCLQSRSHSTSPFVMSKPNVNLKQLQLQQKLQRQQRFNHTTSSTNNNNNNNTTTTTTTNNNNNNNNQIEQLESFILTPLKETAFTLTTLMSSLLSDIQDTLKTILPRRCQEPTGPFVLLFDMLLSLFISCGASKSTINRLPLYIVRHEHELMNNNDNRRTSSSSIDIDNDTEYYYNKEGREREQQEQQDQQEQETASISVTTADKCAICLGPYESGDSVRQLHCQHVFHTECVDPWLEKKSLCPVCKIDPC